MSAITFSDEQIAVGANMTIKQFLVSNGLNPSVIMIRINGQIVSRDQYDSLIIPAGADVKAYPFVGGG